MYNSTQRLMRSRTDKILSGVSGGIARYLAVDPVFVRLAFVAIALSGVGLLIYPILWLVMPLEPEASAGTPVGGPYPSGAGQTRLDPRVNQPDEGEEIPINNVGGQLPPTDVQARRKRFLGIMLVGIGGMFVINMIDPQMSRWVIPSLFIIAGVLLLRRK